MVAHFAGKVASDGVRAVREGGEGRALGFEGTRDGTDGLQTARKKGNVG